MMGVAQCLRQVVRFGLKADMASNSECHCLYLGLKEEIKSLNKLDDFCSLFVRRVRKERERKEEKGGKGKERKKEMEREKTDVSGGTLSLSS